MNEDIIKELLNKIQDKETENREMFKTMQILRNRLTGCEKFIQQQFPEKRIKYYEYYKVEVDKEE